jgi:hypothetical protein
MSTTSSTASPEFLQKFISLADGTRRIEGV